MNLDLIIALLILAALSIGIICNRLILAVLLLLISHIFNMVVNIGVVSDRLFDLSLWVELFNSSSFHYQVKSWELLFLCTMAIASKDFVILVILGLRRRSSEIIIALTFLASLILHLEIVKEVGFSDRALLDLYYDRSNIMMWLTAIQLGVIYLAILKGGQGNGGKRYYINSSRFRDSSNGFFNLSTREANQ